MHRFLSFDELVRTLPKGTLDGYKTVYANAVDALRNLSTVLGHERPTHSRRAHPFTQKGMPEIRRDKFEEGRTESKETFARLAQERVSPFASADEQASFDLDEDLRRALDVLVERGDKISGDRVRRMNELRAIAKTLEPMRKAIDAHKSEGAQEISLSFNVAWTSAVVDAILWPDIEMAARYIDGYDVVFDVKDSSVFIASDEPASISREDFEAANTRMVTTITKEITRSGTSKDPAERERRAQCWKRTKEEIAEGLIRKPKTRAKMDRKYKRGRWRCLGRNAVYQKGKWRCVDNGKRNKANRATSMSERITCGRADFPAVIAREVAKRMQHKTRSGAIRKKRMPRMLHGTDDLRAAYRRVPTRQPEYTNVAVWDSDHRKVVYCEVPGHNFGLKSAVVNFNRFPELATSAARRLLWITTEHYYDDNDTAEPDYARGSGQKCLIELCGDTFFGFPFDDSKHEPEKEVNEYLGVLTDLSRVDAGVITMDVSKKRRDKIRTMVRDIRKSERLPSGLAASLFGKARWMLSPCFGSLGKACLQPIMQREYQRGVAALSTELKDSLEFIEFVCDNLPPLEIPLLPSKLDPVVIFTDAEGKKRQGSRAPTGHLGFVVYHPVYGRRYAHAPAPPNWTKLFDKLRERDTYIAQYELAAAITPFLSLPPEWLTGRPVELWVDNSGAIGALVKGYSGVPDCARIVNLFHFATARLGIHSLWVDYVPSESNPADVPSRAHEMSREEAEKALSGFGTKVAMRVPTIADSNGEWLSSTKIAKSVWG